MISFLTRILQDEGGALSGVPALHDPVSRFFVQTVFIIGMCRGLTICSHYMRQPTVFFEIIGGIIMGPSAFGKIRHFTHTMFPAESLKNLNLVANIGLVLYLFLVGLEMDPKLLRTHAKKAGGIAILGMAVPFALGVAISRLLFDVLQGSDPEFENVNFTSFFVFVGTAMSVTAFPVLARMLKEGGLIYTKPGALAMGAAALNDAIAWCLLVLAISIANAGDLGTAGYVFLSVCAFAVGLVVVVRPIFAQIVAYVESKHSSVMNNHLFAFTLCILFLCAWITAMVGVHAIFGAFLFGIIVPRGSNLFRQCNDRIEELVLTFTLPLYFALSGLSTDITLIRTGREGAVVVLVCVMASLGKFVGAGGAAMIGGMSLRESSVVAVLMNTRGLVELIVLNLGLDSNILSRRTFTVLVLMCLFTTCITSPLLEYIYPIHLRVRSELDVQLSGNDRGGQHDDIEMEDTVMVVDIVKMSKESRLGLVVDCLDQLQSLINVLACFVAHRIDSELSVSAIHFIEPTHTTKDEFLALNENGRLIRVDEETTDCATALRYLEDPSVKTPELLPLSMFCKGMGSAVNAFRVQGDPDEFPLEMKRLIRFNECSMVVMPWRSGSLYASKLFWGSIHIIGSPILLAVQKQPAVRREGEVEERERARTNSALSNSAFPTSPQQLYQRGRTNSLFSGNALSFMFETDDLEAAPPSSSFASHVQLYNASSSTAGAMNRRAAGRQGLSKLSRVAKTHIEIVAVVTGRPMDAAIFPMLLRFAEGKTNSITVHIPADFELFDPNILAALQYFRKEAEPQLPNVRLEFLERVLSTDMDSLFRLAAEVPFDFCISSFVEPACVSDPGVAGDPSIPANHLSSASATRGLSVGLQRVEQRLQSGMPALYAHSALAHPELGELGSRLLEMPCSKACQVLVLHESHKMHFTRIVSAASTAPLSMENMSADLNARPSEPIVRGSKDLSLGVTTRVTINDIGSGCDDEDLETI